MAVYVPSLRLTILHIPKCGGTWVARALETWGVPCRRFNRRHGTLSHLKQYNQYLDEDRPETTAAFVREPFQWYQSFWSRHADKSPALESKDETTNWDPWYPHSLIAHIPGKSFSQWAQAVVDYHPAFVTRMYEWFLGPPGSTHVDFVGRQESLERDLRGLLLSLGCIAPEGAVGRVNERPSVVECNKTLEDAIKLVESPAYRRFGYSSQATT